MAKQLRRDMSNNVIGGVCSGLAKYLDIDPIAVRLAFLLAFLFWGIGPLIYIIMWLLVPSE